MKTPELVIFDIDGLVLNTEFSFHQAWLSTARKYNVPEMYLVFSNTTGLNRVHIDQAMHENFSYLYNLEEIIEEAHAYGKELIRENLNVMPGVPELLDLLDDMKIRKMVATTTPRSITAERLTQMHLLDRFDGMICGDEVTHRKPDPEIYLKALEKAGVPAENALVLEDSVYGVRAAHSAGIDVIMVPSLKNPSVEEREMTSDVVPSLYNVISMLLTKE